MIDAKTIDEIIAHLEAVRKRPMVFLGEKTERALWVYFAGFNAACEILGQLRSGLLWEKIYWQVAEERGWECNSMGAQKHMRDAGWAEEAIVDELLVIEIEQWRRIKADPE